MDFGNKITQMIGTSNKETRKDYKYYCIKRKLKLGTGKIVDGKICGVKGGDVGIIYIKHKGQWINQNRYAKMFGKKIYPIRSLTKTPFIDMRVI